MNNIERERLRQINTFPSLVKYLRDELDWPIESDDFEDLTFEYEPEELGIDPKNAAKIDKIMQLRPLLSNQPWGIFFVKFEPKKLPVVVLRRILRELVIKKRASANRAGQATWELNDLLFISNYGEGEQRQITFAHFSENAQSGDLPTLKVLGWDEADTALHLDHVHDVLQEQLSWPEDEEGLEAWRADWGSAFLRHREVISTSKQLALRLADLAHGIRARVNAALAVETEKGPLRTLMAAFKESLIHDLKDDDFADMYAQTIAYGLLSARIADPKKKTADDFAAHMRTSPFLRELMETFLAVGGRKGKAGGPGIDFDELGVSEVVELLDEANMEAVVRDFGDKNRQEDPVIHFYELFLHEYNKQLKIQRGVFYTPQPVVSYIVRSVHELLQTEFGLADGLADTTTWGEMLKQHKDLKLPPLTDAPGEKLTISPDDPFVQILDPATGTATFLVEVIDVINKTMTAKWKKQGKKIEEIDKLWNDYVPQHLLPRLHAYELMMAPYAIAHMKVGLKLAETGYRFETEERARIYLTNALEPWQKQLKLPDFAALAHEAAAVNEIKRKKRFTVVIGNPPYAGHSSNFGDWIAQLIDNYYFVDDKPLNEKNPKWLQDDYVKFVRLAEATITHTGTGVHSYITNHGYIDNPTFRGMRQHLMKSFDLLRVYDLHGSTKKGEQCPSGGKDENVFDILPGVAIMLNSLLGRRTQASEVLRADLWGERQKKYDTLGRTTSATTLFSKLDPASPFYMFMPQDRDLRDEYGKAWKITEAMPLNILGFQTHRDDVAVSEDKARLKEKVAKFLGATPPKDEWEEYAQVCSYRPFDNRFAYLSKTVCDRPRPDLLHHVSNRNSLCLLLPRQQAKMGFRHAWITKYPANDCVISTTSREANQVFPLWQYPSHVGLEFNSEPQPNFTSRFLNEFSKLLQLGQTKSNGLPAGVIPENILHYAYAVFHSPGYRTRFAEFLKIDFPRLPLTGNLELFRALARLGGELTALHLLESPKLKKPITKFIGNNPVVTKVGWTADEGGTVWLDGKGTAKNFQPGTSGFRPVPEEVWNFQIGGYQVCEKWLKDRQARGGKNARLGRILTDDDIAHYQKIVVALSETIRLMQEIDEVIDKYGGWPDAFVTDNTSH